MQCIICINDFNVILPSIDRWVTDCNNASSLHIVLWCGGQPARSTQPSTLCGMVKWVLCPTSDAFSSGHVGHGAPVAYLGDLASAPAPPWKEEIYTEREIARLSPPFSHFWMPLGSPRPLYLILWNYCTEASFSNVWNVFKINRQHAVTLNLVLDNVLVTFMGNRNAKLSK